MKIQFRTLLNKNLISFYFFILPCIAIFKTEEELELDISWLFFELTINKKL